MKKETLVPSNFLLCLHAMEDKDPAFAHASGSFSNKKQKTTGFSGVNLSGSEQVQRRSRAQSRLSRFMNSVRHTRPPSYNTYNTMARTPLVTDWSDPDSYHLQGNMNAGDTTGSRSGSFTLTVLKWTFTLILLFLLVVSSVLSKTTFASIASTLAVNNSGVVSGSNAQYESKRSIAFVQLVLILITPQVLTILKALFLGIIGKGNKRFPWPSRQAIVKVRMPKYVMNRT